MTLGKRIKRLRQERKITLRKLAISAGISPSYLSHLETERTLNPSMEILCKISSELKTTINYLCYGENKIELDRFEDLPKSIQEFISENKERCDIQNEDILDLMGMKYRGNQPKTGEGWAYLFSSIKLVIEKGL